MKIGFIGTGYVGGAYAHYLRDHDVVLYNNEEHIGNKALIKDCEVVFIAVPTPTNEKGFDRSIVDEALTITTKGQIIIIKSTLLPGTTKQLQFAYPDRSIIYSPEFLTEKNAKEDILNQDRCIIGLAGKQDVIDIVKSVLPPTKTTLITNSTEAELIKYASNIFLTLKVVYSNIIADVCDEYNADSKTVLRGMSLDHRIGPSHTDVSGPRGAGGRCFIKDLAAFNKVIPSPLLETLEKTNIHLLVNSNKDIDLVNQVYGWPTLKEKRQ